MKRISRIVTLPDYQGVGIGTTALNWIANMYKNKGYRVSITTTTPALIHSFNKSNDWILKRQGRAASASKKSKIEIAKNKAGTSSINRITTSWEYVNNTA